MSGEVLGGGCLRLWVPRNMAAEVVIVRTKGRELEFCWAAWVCCPSFSFPVATSNLLSSYFSTTVAGDPTNVLLPSNFTLLHDCLSLSHSPSSSLCPNVWPTLTRRFLLWNWKYSGQKSHPLHSKQLGHHSLSFNSHYQYLWNLVLCKTLFLVFGRRGWMKECP